MKKTFLILYVLMSVLTAQADAPDYSFLSFETVDGSVVSVSVSSLNISIEGTALTAGDKTFALSNLRKMYFSKSDETTKVEQLVVKDWSKVTDIYDLNGRKVSREKMGKGVYIIKSKTGTYQLIAQ